MCIFTNKGHLCLNFYFHIILHIMPYELPFNCVNFSVYDTVNSNTRKFLIFHNGIIELDSLTNDLKLCNNIFMF